jgi:uncharacterized membrane protein YbhN (UPF0104 family)
MLRRYTSLLVLLIIILLIAVYLWNQRELLEALQNITLVIFLALVLLRLAIMVLNGLFLHIFALKFDVHLHTLEWFGLAAVTTMGNYITPLSGGLVARAAYLKHRHQLPYTQFTTLLASNYIVMFWLIGVAGLLVLGWLGLFELDKWPIILLFGIVVVGISLFVMLPPFYFQSNNRWLQRLNRLTEGWQQIRTDRKLLLKLIICTFLVIVVNGLSFWIGYQALGITISFSVGLLLGLVAAFSIFINITPGSLGVQEAMVSLSSELLGAGAGQGLLVVLLIRAATIVSAFTLGPLFTIWLTNQVPGQEARQAK